MMNLTTTRVGAQNVRSRGIGSRVGTLIGLGWMVYGLNFIPNLIRVPLGLLGLGVAVWLSKRSHRLITLSWSLPEPGLEARTANRRAWGWFWLNFVGEVVLLNVAINLLVAPQLRIYWTPAISFVVGLHFLPMAKIFSVPFFLVCGGAMMAVALVATIALRSQIGPPPGIIATEALVNACILWTTAAWGTRLATQPTALD